MKLRPYQQEGVKFLQSGSGILADDMGLGKTATALHALPRSNTRCLIVCPNYVKSVWHAELHKWLSYEAWDCRGTSPAALNPNTHTVICHYDVLKAWSPVLTQWAPTHVVFDEAHALMNESSQRSKAAREVVRQAERVWMLTGTPLTNRPRDLWNVVDICRPGYLGGFFKFALRYCDAQQKQVTPMKRVWVFSGKSNLQELGERLRPIMLRRTKSDVSSQLPPKTRQLIWADIKSTALMLNAGTGAGLRKALDASADRKLPEVERLLLGHLEAGHKVVCFTWRKSVAESLQQAGIAAGYASEVVHGGVSTLIRGSRIQRCRDATTSLLTATIDSSGTGIDLSYADVVVFAELSWEPHKLLQAEARAHRFGQQNPVLIQYVCARNTSDEIVANVVLDKLGVYEDVMGKGDDGLRDSLGESEEDIMSQLNAAIEGMRQ